MVYYIIFFIAITNVKVECLIRGYYCMCIRIQVVSGIVEWYKLSMTRHAERKKSLVILRNTVLLSFVVPLTLVICSVFRVIVSETCTRIVITFNDIV